MDFSRWRKPPVLEVDRESPGMAQRSLRPSRTEALLVRGSGGLRTG
jgi:hypothetical protein